MSNNNLNNLNESDYYMVETMVMPLIDDLSLEVKLGVVLYYTTDYMVDEVFEINMHDFLVNRYGPNDEWGIFYDRKLMDIRILRSLTRLSMKKPDDNIFNYIPMEFRPKIRFVCEEIDQIFKLVHG